MGNVTPSDPAKRHDLIAPAGTDIDPQLVVDAGLNVFAATLLAESYIPKPWNKVQFTWRGVRFTLERDE